MPCAAKSCRGRGSRASLLEGPDLQIQTLLPVWAIGQLLEAHPKGCEHPQVPARAEAPEPKSLGAYAESDWSAAPCRETSAKDGLMH